VSDGHYFEARPAVASRPRTVTLSLPDMVVELQTDRGVFSAGGIDPGTQVLLEDGPPPPSTGAVLDLGCGYGPIALALARRSPGLTVYAVDLNQRAVALTASNAAALELSNVRTAVSDGVAFEQIWSNPPVRVGKDALHQLLLAWLPRLAAGGRAYLVVQKHLGSDSLQRWLTETGWPTSRLGSRRGYRILEVQRP
jgi:16S rRNA (guanine1207-N2)-methyltransferase